MPSDTTLIEELSKNKNTKVHESDDPIDIIFDMNENIEKRIHSLNAYYLENGENTVEIINKLCNMYSLSGTNLLENFLQAVCDMSSVSVLLKLITVKSLLSFKQKPETENEDDDGIKQLEIKRVNDRNEKRRLNNLKVLNEITMGMGGVSIPQQLDAIFTLMEAPEYKIEGIERFRVFLGNHTIPCDYRYKTILELEHYNDEKQGGRRFIPNCEFFLKESLFFFIHDRKNTTMYRILAGQYILQNLRKVIENDERKDIQNILLIVAQDVEMDFNIRADAADTLLNVGDGEYIITARETIALLSFAMGQRRTVFDNAQNVHVTEIEESIADILSVIIDTPMMRTESGENITFEFVRNKIENVFSINKGKKCVRSCRHIKCEICDNCVKHKDSVCCDNECDMVLDKKTKIAISLNRIAIDRVLYSKYSITLSGILLRVWSYISRHEANEEMRKRLLEELYDMSGTCSTGFASRLINVVSGFDDLNIHISWRDQIVSNFTGRLNALARKIDHEDSVYFTDESHINDLVILYLSTNPNAYKIPINEKKNDTVKNYLKIGRKKKISLIVEEFKSNVLIEMSINTMNTSARANFLKFFRDNMLKIREEMYMEFRDYMTDTDFDLWFRAAIMSYETGNTD
jgi:hypothetical protein